MKFIEEARGIHGDRYDYYDTVYIKDLQKVSIRCLVHGDFEQHPKNHLQGRGCRECSGKNGSNTYQFIEKSIKVHGNKYDYNETVYIGAAMKVKIRCLTHGIFKQTPNSHLSGNGCPDCGKGLSKGERSVMNWLANSRYNYVREHRFSWCRDKNPLPFDFQVFIDENKFILIEVDGRQHREPVVFFGGVTGFLNIRERDAIKTRFCYDNNITLLRLEYDGSDSSSTDRIVAELETFMSALV